MTERTIAEILKFISTGETDGYANAQDTKDGKKTDLERAWFHGYADACHDLETFIRKTGPFREEKAE